MLEQVKRKCGDRKCDAKRLASHIIYRSYSIFTHRHLRNPNLRFVDVFERAISEQVNFMVNNPSNFLTSVQRANSTDLFRALEMKKKSGSFFSRRSPVTYGDYSKGENSLDQGAGRHRKNLSGLCELSENSLARRWPRVGCVLLLQGGLSLSTVSAKCVCLCSAAGRRIQYQICRASRKQAQG